MVARGLWVRRLLGSGLGKRDSSPAMFVVRGCSAQPTDGLLFLSRPRRASEASPTHWGLRSPHVGAPPRPLLEAVKALSVVGRDGHCAVFTGWPSQGL